MLTPTLNIILPAYSNVRAEENLLVCNFVPAQIGLYCIVARRRKTSVTNSLVYMLLVQATHYIQWDVYS